ncbi:hypothetical protein HNQ91_001311 [Filimonas zeae]|uniref:Photosynthetic reaction center cytochrome c subunit n=1 Tax=Filimonas zeae TaxID=1737353 RepID=A0A917IT34_9BACT|nr:c-type cytochrome [Filimonas zeae]MDR6338289.1 hypothetical protein [Filimonas zeae]GGH62660.1 hypothetical protein GCM10011379_12840 [Filimonas zeae]
MIKTHRKKVAVIGVLCASVILSLVAYKPVEQPRKRNLKVLPQNISRDSLDKIMKSYNEALGVKCSYCHAENKETGRMSFGSDDKHEKETTRHMMMMTDDINKKYFMDAVDSADAAKFLPKVSCITCHKGQTIP